MINTSSGAGLLGSVGQGTYSAAKAGIAALTMVESAERANLPPVAPGQAAGGACPADAVQPADDPEQQGDRAYERHVGLIEGAGKKRATKVRRKTGNDSGQRRSIIADDRAAA